MGDPVSASTALLVTGGVTESAAAWLGGRQQRAAFKSEAQQMQTQKKAIEANAAITEEERMLQLKKVLATQNAIFAMSGQTAGVGSAKAITAESISEANRETYNRRLQKQLATSAMDYNIWSAKQASKRAMQTSLLNFAVDYSSRAFSSIMKNRISGGEDGGDTTF